MMANYTHFLQTLTVIICMLCSLSKQDSMYTERFLPTFDPVVVVNDHLSSCSAKNGKEVPSSCQQWTTLKSSQTMDGRLVKIVDDVLDFRLMTSLQEFNSGDGPSPWSTSLDPGPFENSAVLSVLRGLVSSAMDVDETVLKPFSISMHVFRRGDHVALTRDNTGVEKEYSLILYFNQYWRKNDYGELLFYDDNNDTFTALSPKYNRAVVWDSSIGYIMKPPSMDFKQGMMCLRVRFTTNATKESKARQRRELHFEEKMKARETLFTEMKGSEVKTVEDVANCVTKNYTTSQGKRLYIFDGLFNADDLMKLREFVPKHGKFYFDDSLDLDSDNVQWIAGFPIDSYVQGKMWTATQKVAEFVSGTDQWYPYDVSCNLLRTYDHTRIHEDCEVREKEWTFLVYLTDDWSEDKYGETTFLHFHGHDSEPVISVLPRFGRVVIFEGIIPHSARPPSPTYRDSRLTFVAKLSINEWVARVKSLKTEFGHEEGIHQLCLGHFKSYNDKHYEDHYKERLLENAQELRELNQALNKRFRPDAEHSDDDDDNDDDDDDRDDDDDQEEDEEQMEYDEPSSFDDEMLLEVKRRRDYVYGLFADRSQSIETLRKHYNQCLMDARIARHKYVEQMEKLI
ncbi:uncharacterized protein LOC753783 isoform X2 [Strongylocentrotus purpuratus]|uniref:Prolyl 4-hydroxylase alpha subunit domain-containing protein n=1 Tax=Strongylocentrotus purpuratus TaxID=7668 RepID=A0A7M7NVX9_STRPU|nr:uncharacterized protein LOC753783 isoform X2 [Strongylocentrotus purpuratus]